MTSLPSLSSRFPSFRGTAGFACHNLKLSCTAALQHRKPGDTTTVLVSNDLIWKMGPTEVVNSKLNTKKGVLGRAYFRNRDCFQSFWTIYDMSMTDSDRTWIHMHIKVILSTGAGLQLSAAYHHVTSSRDCLKTTKFVVFFDQTTASMPLRPHNTSRASRFDKCMALYRKTPSNTHLHSLGDESDSMRAAEIILSGRVPNGPDKNSKKRCRVQRKTCSESFATYVSSF